MIVIGDFPATTGSKNSSSPARRNRVPLEIGFRDGQRRYISADVDSAALKRRIGEQWHCFERWTKEGQMLDRVVVPGMSGQNALAGEFAFVLPGCVGDLDGDGDTDLADLGILLADFGCPQPGPCAGDLDGDGDTDLADLGILLADFGCDLP